MVGSDGPAVKTMAAGPGGDGVIDPIAIRQLCTQLEERLQRDEAALGYPKPPRTLYAHSVRVARRARRLAEQMGSVAPEMAFLAGVLHDAGKLRDGLYHQGDRPEEEISAEVAEELLVAAGVEPSNARVEIADAVRRMQREDPPPPALAQIIWDADALDKLGPCGVAAFFLKSGLRGRGLDERLLERTSVELTYARAAPETMWTDAGEREAAPAAAYTERYFRDLIDVLVASGVCDVTIEMVQYQDMEIVSVGAPRCGCGGRRAPQVHSAAGVICTELFLTRRCEQCGNDRTVRFCSPRVRKRRDVETVGENRSR